MGVVFFLGALLSAMLGSVCIAHALRLPRIRTFTARFRRFPKSVNADIKVGSDALVGGAVRAGAKTFEVPHTFERAVWIRYRMEELGREYRCLAEYIECEPFSIGEADEERPLGVDLRDAHVETKPTSAKLLSDLFDDEMPAFSLALPQVFQDTAFAKMEEKPGLYRLAVDALVVGDKLWLSGRAKADERTLGAQMAQHADAPLHASNLPEQELTAAPHPVMTPLGIAFGIGLIALGLRIFFFAGAD